MPSAWHQLLFCSRFASREIMRISGLKGDANMGRHRRACVPGLSEGYCTTMARRLQITPQDCSPLGRFILQYLEENTSTMNSLAEKSGVPQPRLRGACFKGTCPTPETLRKLAKAIGVHHLELYTLAYEGRVVTFQDKPDAFSLDLLVRELLEAARESGLKAPEHQPSKAQIRDALITLGFQSNLTLTA